MLYILLQLVCDRAMPLNLFRVLPPASLKIANHQQSCPVLMKGPKQTQPFTKHATYAMLSWESCLTLMTLDSGYQCHDLYLSLRQ